MALNGRKVSKSCANTALLTLQPFIIPPWDSSLPQLPLLPASPVLLQLLLTPLAPLICPQPPQTTTSVTEAIATTAAAPIKCILILGYISLNIGLAYRWEIVSGGLVLFPKQRNLSDTWLKHFANIHEVQLVRIAATCHMVH